MPRRRRHFRTWLTLAVGAALTGVVVAFTLAGALDQLELDTVDARFAVRGNDPPPEDIVVVAIDDVTFDELETRWPFPRRMHAKVIDVIRRAGARAIVYDVQFTEPTTDDQDAALMAAVERARGRIVLATSEVNELGESAIFGGEDVVRSLGARSGNALLPNDGDGVIRRVAYEVDGMTSVGVVAAGMADGRPVPRDAFGSGYAWIDYHGPSRAIPTLSFSRVYREAVDPARIRDRIVVVGPAAPSLQDVHPTSMSAEVLTSGAEIHANVISTVRRGLPLQDTPRWLDAVLVAVLGMGVPVAGAALARGRGILVAPVGGLLVVALAALYAVAAQLAFGLGLILPVVYPLAAVAFSSMGILGVEATVAAMERQLLLRYVPPEDVASLDGPPTRCRATVIFCDLRGFTRFSERRDNEEVAEVLDRYFQEMSQAIRSRKGTLVQYQGDGILAAFGVPVAREDHADRALDAVREMLHVRLPNFNAWVRSRGYGDGFEVGIGVDSGRILSLSVGDDWRSDFTVLGDAVNTACRLEKLTKEVPHQVLISDTTQEWLSGIAPDLRYVGTVTVRGKEAADSIWTIGEPPPGRVPQPSAGAVGAAGDRPTG